MAAVLIASASAFFLPSVSSEQPALVAMEKPAQRSWVNAEPAPERLPSGSYQDCPCLEEDDINFTEALIVAASKADILDTRREDNVYSPDIDFREYLLNHGHSCSDWWKVIDPLCWNRYPPRFCDAKWCYVSAENCEERREITHSTGFQAPGISFSAATCGTEPTRNKIMEQMFSKKKLYVYSNGLAVDEHAPWDDGSPMLVASIRMASALFTGLGIRKENLFYRRLSPEALAYGGNFYDACVWDVAVGSIDMCVLDVWDLAARREFSADAVFSGQINAESVYLFLPKSSLEAPQTFWDILILPLAPFSAGLWCTIVAGIVFYALGMRLFDGGCTKANFCSPKGLMYQFYVAFISFLSGGIPFTARTASGKIFSLGFGLFIVIALATFTANTATFLLDRSFREELTIDELLSSDVMVCVAPTLLKVVSLSYPGIAGHHVLLEPTDTSVFDRLNIGSHNFRDGKEGCAFALLPESLVTPHWGAGRHCDITKIGNPVAIMPTGFWLRSELAPAVAWHLASMRVDGTWRDIKEDAIAKSACESNPSVEGVQLEARHMLGNIFLLVFCVVISLVVHWWSRNSEKFTRACSFGVSMTRSFRNSLSGNLGNPSNVGEIRHAPGQPEGDTISIPISQDSNNDSVPAERGGLASETSEEPRVSNQPSTTGQCADAVTEEVMRQAVVVGVRAGLDHLRESVDLGLVDRRPSRSIPDNILDNTRSRMTL